MKSKIGNGSSIYDYDTSGELFQRNVEKKIENHKNFKAELKSLCQKYGLYWSDIRRHFVELLEEVGEVKK